MKVYHTIMNPPASLPATIFIGAPIPEGRLIGVVSHLTGKEIEIYMSEPKFFEADRSFPIKEKAGEMSRAVLVLDTEV